MKCSTFGRSSGEFVTLRIHLSNGSYKAVNAAPTTQCSTILEKVVGYGYSKEDFELKVKYKNCSPFVLSDNTYLKDLIPAAKNDELEEIALCKKTGGITRCFSHDLLLHSHFNKVKPLDIVTISLPLQREYDVAPVKNEKIASIFSTAWSVGTQHHEKMPANRSLSVVSPPPLDSISQSDSFHHSVTRTRKVTIPVLQKQTRKRVGIKIQRRNLFRRSSSTSTLVTHRPCSSSSGDVSDNDNAIDGCSDITADGHYADVPSLQYCHRRSLSVGDLRCLPCTEYMVGTTSPTVNYQLEPNATNHGSLAELKSSRSVQLLTDDDIEQITEYTLQLDSEDDMSLHPDDNDAPYAPERTTSLNTTHFSIPDAVLIEQGKRWNAVFGSREKKASGGSWNFGAIKSALNKMARKISTGRKQSLVDESSKLSNTNSPPIHKKPLVNFPAIGLISLEQDMAKSRLSNTRSYSPNQSDPITPIEHSHRTLPSSLHLPVGEGVPLQTKKYYSSTDIPLTIVSPDDDYVVMSSAYVQTREFSKSQLSVAVATPSYLELKNQNTIEPVYDVPSRLSSSQSLSHEFIHDDPVQRSTTPSVLFGTPLPSPMSDPYLVPAYSDDTFTNTRPSNLDITATVSTNSFEKIDSSQLSWIYGDYPDAAPDC